MQSQHIYMTDSLEQFIAPEIKDSFPFYGKALHSYRLDDYTRFTTMEEVLREYVREINVGVRGANKLIVKLLNEDVKEFYTNDILVLVDGIPIFNSDKIFSLDPLKIRNIDIVSRNYILGSSFFHGVASFSSYNGNHEGIDIDPKAISLDYEGLQIQRQFYSPDYSTEQLRNSRIPDLRSTLFWQPSINTNQKVQFYTGDDKGRYLITLEGISNTGEPISLVYQFEVK